MFMCACSVTQLGQTLCDPMGSSPPGSSIYWIFQARILEWAAISYSRVSSQQRDWTCVSCIGGWILCHWATWQAPKKCPSLCNRDRDGRTPLVDKKPSLYVVESDRVSKRSDGWANPCIPGGRRWGPDLGRGRHVDKGAEIKSPRVIQVLLGSYDLKSDGDLICKSIHQIFAKHLIHGWHH